MKSLFVTLLLLGGAFLALDYTGSLGERIVFKSLNKPASVSSATPAVEPKAPEKTPVPEPPKPAAVASAPPAAAPSAPVAATPPPAETAKPGADADGFVTPKYEPLGTLAKGWTMIPKSAFPRQVKLTKPAEFKMSVGTSSMKAGAEVTALAFAEGQLSLAPNAASSARAVVALDETNLKEVLEAGYVEWKAARTALAKRSFLANKARQGSTAPAAAPGSLDAGGKPLRGSDGSFPLLVASLKSGEVTELKLQNIHRWEDPAPSMVEGKPAWSIKVQADVETVFGLQPTEVQAVVRDGRVKGWYYTGSGEPVP